MSELIIAEKEKIDNIAAAVRKITESNNPLSLEEIAENLNLMTGFIPKPQKAEVGQVLKVSTVDENGVPTAWETAEPPSNEYKWEKIIEYTVPENTTYVTFTEDLRGEPFSLKKAVIYVFLPVIKGEDGSFITSGTPTVTVSDSLTADGGKPHIYLPAPWNTSASRSSSGMLYVESLSGAGCFSMFGMTTKDGSGNSAGMVYSGPENTASYLKPSVDGGTVYVEAIKVGNYNSIAVGAGAIIRVFGVRA